MNRAQVGRLLSLALLLAALPMACGGGGANGEGDQDGDGTARLDDLPGGVELCPEPDLGSELPADGEADFAPEQTAPPPFAPGACGLDYRWLPATAVGGVVAFEEVALTKLEPAMIDALLVQAGYDFLPARFGVRNFRMRYLTQDRGKLVEATALVGVPTGMDAGESAPVCLWLHGTSGAMDLCAPSRDPLLGPAVTSIIASQGYLAVAPDYIGMNAFGEPSPPGTIHAYLVGEPVALGSLDSARAALAALQERPELTPGDGQRVVLLGGSQGGHAAFFVDRYQPYYAPELTIRAAVAAVPPASVTGQCQHAAQSEGAGMGLMGFALAAMSWWYGSGDLATIFTDEEPHFIASSLIEWMATGCGDHVDVSDLERLEQLYSPLYLANAPRGNWAPLAPFDCFLRENSIPGTSVPLVGQTPFIMVLGETDDLLYTPVERENLAALCAEGYRIEYLECAGLGHSEAPLTALSYTVTWLEQRLKGEPWEAPICTVTPPADCTAL